MSSLQRITQDLPTIAAMAVSFGQMREQLQEVIDEQQRRKGAWKAVLLMGTMLMGAVTLGGILVGIAPEIVRHW